MAVRHVVALPVLLFGARHNKFDITNELDSLHRQYPHLTFHYGAPLGITLPLLEELKQNIERDTETAIAYFERNR